MAKLIAIIVCLMLVLSAVAAMGVHEFQGTAEFMQLDESKHKRHKKQKGHKNKGHGYSSGGYGGSHGGSYGGGYGGGFGGSY